MRVDLLTREYPPEVYGGAGVHVEYLARELRRLVDVRVHCFGAPRDEPGVTAYGVPGRRWPAPTPALRTLGVDLEMAAGCDGRRPGALATPGTPTSPGTWPSCCTACRTW